MGSNQFMTEIYRCNYFAEFTSDPLFSLKELKLQNMEVLSLPPLFLEVVTVFRFVYISLDILYFDHGESINNI